MTDSEKTIKYELSRPGVYNLIEIYSQMANMSPQEVEAKFEGKGYREFKEDLARVINVTLGELQKKYYKLRQGNELSEILRSGAEKAYKLSHPKLLEVYKKVGFV